LEELFRSLNTVRERAKYCGDWLTGINPTCPNCFDMIYNAATLTLELLNHYFDIWKRTAPRSISAEELKKDNVERVFEITKWAFISALSSVEYTSKEMLRMVSDNSFEYLRARIQSGKWVYLSQIIERSKEIEFIDEEQYKTWRALIHVRNAVVHNNAIADADVEYKIDNLEITFVKGECLRGKLDFFIRLLEVTVDQQHEWLRALLVDPQE